MEPFVFSATPPVSPMPAAALHRKLEIGCGGIIRGQISENGSPASRKGDASFRCYTRSALLCRLQIRLGIPRAIIRPTRPSVLALYGVTLTRPATSSSCTLSLVRPRQLLSMRHFTKVHVPSTPNVHLALFTLAVRDRPLDKSLPFSPTLLTAETIPPIRPPSDKAREQVYPASRPNRIWLSRAAEC